MHHPGSSVSSTCNPQHEPQIAQRNQPNHLVHRTSPKRLVEDLHLNRPPNPSRLHRSPQPANLNHTTPHHPPPHQHVGRGNDPIRNMKREDPLTRPRDLRVNLWVPPDVIHIHHNANPPRIELPRNVIRLSQRHHHRPVRSEHRMQRLHAQPHPTLSSMCSNLTNPIHHHLPNPIDIAVRSRPIHQHQQIGPHSRRLIDSPQIILNPLSPLLRRSRRKHPTPPQTRDPQPSLPYHPARLSRTTPNRIPH